MSITYRTAQPSDEEALLQLWINVLADSYANRQQLFGDFCHDPQRFARTQVAINAEGTICGAVTYWLRQMHQADGNTALVGHLWGMATDPAYRRQGIATTLLQRIETAMQQAGCQWAILSAREEARSLYERLGWQGIPTLYRGGLSLENLALDARYHVRRYDPWQEPTGWQPLAAVYAHYNHQRPASLVRPLPYWQGYLAWMAQDWIEHQCAQYWVVTPTDEPQTISGYALVHFYDHTYAASHFNSPPWFALSEIGVIDDDSGAIHALLAGMIQQAQAQQMVYGHLCIPQESRLESALQQTFRQPLNPQEVTGSLMVRTITPNTTDETADHFTAPGALLWEIDRY